MEIIILVAIGVALAPVAGAILGVLFWMFAGIVTGSVALAWKIVTGFIDGVAKLADAFLAMPESIVKLFSPKPKSK